MLDLLGATFVKRSMHRVRDLAAECAGSTIRVLEADCRAENVFASLSVRWERPRFQESAK
jgi:hypothetical protein